MPLTLLIAPAEEPVSLDEAKLHCKVDGFADDSLITALIIAARQRAEHETGRALITQKWRLALDGFPVAAIAIPNPPLQSVEAISYVDTEGAVRTLDAAAYRTHKTRLVGLVTPTPGTAWPVARKDYDTVQIDFTVGYGERQHVPQAVKQWMLLAIGTWYAQRETMVPGQAVQLPYSFWDALLDPYRVVQAL